MGGRRRGERRRRGRVVGVDGTWPCEQPNDEGEEREEREGEEDGLVGFHGGVSLRG